MKGTAAPKITASSLDARAFAEELDQIVRFANLTNVFFRK